MALYMYDLFCVPEDYAGISGFCPDGGFEVFKIFFVREDLCYSFRNAVPILLVRVEPSPYGGSADNTFPGIAGYRLCGMVPGNNFPSFIEHCYHDECILK